MLIERRVYDLQAGALSAFLDLVEKEELPMLGPHVGRIVGYYHTEIGALHQIIGIWRFESFEEREAGRAAFREHSNFLSLAERLLPMVRRQSCEILVPAALGVNNRYLCKGAVVAPNADSMRPRADGGTLIEQQVTTTHAGRLAEYLETVETLERPLLSSADFARIVGYYYTDVGRLNQVITLRRFRSYEDRKEARRQITSDPRFGALRERLLPLILFQTSQLLLPAPFFHLTGPADIDAAS